MYEKNLLKSEVAIVTGGGTGIGKEIALNFSKLGAKVVIAGLKEDKLKSALKDIKKVTKYAMYVKTDIRKEDEVANLFKQTSDKFGKIDILVNNAGGQFIAPFEKISANGFDAVVKTNLYGTWFCCREATKYMRTLHPWLNYLHHNLVQTFLQLTVLFVCSLYLYHGF